MRRRQHQSAFADFGCAFRSEKPCLDRRGSGRAERTVHALGGLEYLSADQYHCGREHAKRSAGNKRLRQIGLWRTVSTFWYASLLLQDLRARSRIGFTFRREAEPVGWGDERSCDCAGRIDGSLFAQKIAVAAVCDRRGIQFRPQFQSEATTVRIITRLN